MCVVCVVCVCVCLDIFLLVLLALYVWQLPWLPEDSSLTSLIGFQHFPNVWAGFGWHMAILGFSVAQNELNKVSTRGFLFKKPTPDQRTHTLPSASLSLFQRAA